MRYGIFWQYYCKRKSLIYLISNMMFRITLDFACHPRSGIRAVIWQPPGSLGGLSLTPI